MKNAIWVVITITALLTAAGASSDPFAGKWVLEPQQSKYPPGTCPTHMVIEMEPVANGIRYRSDATYEKGRTAHAEYAAEYNGRQVLVVGAHGLLLPVSLKRIDSRTVVASYMRGFQVIATSRRVVSSDGLRMSITTTSKDRSGRRLTTIGIYRRQMEKRDTKPKASPRYLRTADQASYDRCDARTNAALSLGGQTIARDSRINRNRDASEGSAHRHLIPAQSPPSGDWRGARNEQDSDDGAKRINNGLRSSPPRWHWRDSTTMYGFTKAWPSSAG